MARAQRHQWSADGQEEAPRPSRSAKKRASHALQDMGAELARLPLPEMRALNLPAELTEALNLYARIRNHEGRRRQLQFIGRLMREVDSEPVRVALEARQEKAATASAALHRAEQWRDRLVAAPEAELDALLDALLVDLPGMDAAAVASLRGELCALALEARLEKAAGSAPRAARALFRALHGRLVAAYASALGAVPAAENFLDKNPVRNP